MPTPGRRAVPALDALLAPQTPERHRPAVERDLAAFTGAGYDKGRSRLWQAAWFATMNLVFSKWWLPARFRPPILRAFGARVGERVLIRHRVRVLWPWQLSIGDDCWIGEGVWLLNLEPITIEDDVCLSQESMLCTGSHRHHDPAFEFDNGPIRIGRGAWVAARATVLRGTTVDAGEVVPAHAVRSRTRRP
ncbi:putative colanic acid biosynthesis acetyltransferase [Kineosporia sp. J2-2]|uniref:Colanic acid biosynthesis acetyltransferase n=1 Tax=Kineosporia corallincola TaxID=2835133 RepID=A0ABS5TF28_9ACTN|nr:putative colanic acid biosynthesis acetyltransferase [Kineosporia corallincola]MBT0769671.1 putative colanic acid biosynthesis acetyltransferase [Kineosporia corallincola]